MKFPQLLRDTLCVLRATRLIWVLGFIITLDHIANFRDSLAGVQPGLGWIFATVGLIALIFSLIATGALVRLVYEIGQNESLSFDDLWHRSRARYFRIMGAGLLFIPIEFVLFAIYLILARNAPGSSLLWLVGVILEAANGSLWIFLLCTIMIDDVKAILAAWTSVLITLNNFFRLLLILGAIFLIRVLFTGLVALILTSSLFHVKLRAPLAFDYISYLWINSLPIIIVARWVFDLFLVPFSTVMLTLCYTQFAREVTYPALAKPPAPVDFGREVTTAPNLEECPPINFCRRASAPLAPLLARSLALLHLSWRLYCPSMDGNHFLPSGETSSM